MAEEWFLKDKSRFILLEFSFVHRRFFVTLSAVFFHTKTGRTQRFIKNGCEDNHGRNYGCKRHLPGMQTVGEDTDRGEAVNRRYGRYLRRKAIPFVCLRSFVPSCETGFFTRRPEGHKVSPEWLVETPTTAAVFKR